MTIEDRLTELEIALPAVPHPKGAYIPAVRHGSLCWSAGQLPLQDDELRFEGRLGREVSLEDGQRAAELAALNGLAAIRNEIGSLDSIERIIRVRGFVNSDDGFQEQHLVMNGASELLHRIFGDKGRHARTAVATNILPFNAAIEMEMIVGVR